MTTPRIPLLGRVVVVLLLLGALAIGGCASVSVADLRPPILGTTYALDVLIEHSQPTADIRREEWDRLREQVRQNLALLSELTREEE